MSCDFWGTPKEPVNVFHRSKTGGSSTKQTHLDHWKGFKHGRLEISLGAKKVCCFSEKNIFPVLNQYAPILRVSRAGKLTTGLMDLIVLSD